MKGKEKCKALKEIRRQIAEKNDIPFAVSQCTHQGDCKGTCPKCESELRYLERELAVRQGLGKAVAIAGISIGACTAFTACSPMDTITDFIEGTGDEILGGEATLGPDNDFDFGTPPKDSFITGEETDRPDEEYDDTLAGYVEKREPDETLPQIEGDISLEP